MQILGKRLKQLRDEFGFDQKEMGRKLNITSSAYGYYEQGRNEPPLETLVKIAEIFNVTTDYLLGRSDIRENSVYYTLSDKLTWTQAELLVIERMQENLLLKQLSENPENNVARLYRYWEFIMNEHKKDYLSNEAPNLDNWNTISLNKEDDNQLIVVFFVNI